MGNKDEQITLLKKQVSDMQEMYVRDVSELKRQLDAERAKGSMFVPHENQGHKVRHV